MARGGFACVGLEAERHVIPRKLILGLVASLIASPAWAAGDLLITRANLWTPEGVHHNQDVLIRDGRVAAVARHGKVKLPPKEARAALRIVDAHGDTLLPGLIDAHVHLVSGVRMPDTFDGNARAIATAKQLLRSGVTSGRIHLWDIGSASAFKQQAARDDFASPRLQIGGPAIFGGQPDWEAEDGNVWGIRNAENAKQKLRRLRAAGADWVTLHEFARFQPGELDALKAEAGRLGIRLAGGADRFSEIELAVDLGVETLEYQDRSDTPVYPEALIAKMRARGDTLYLVPAFSFQHRYAAYRQGRLNVAEPRFTEFYPPEVAAFAAGALSEDQSKPIQWAPTWTEVPVAMPGKFRQLRAAGLQMVTGTDCGSPAHSQADSIWWELDTWRRHGVSADDALRGATSLAARMLRDPDVGHLRVGARGDFVLYRGRPDDGPFSVERVRTVGKGGRVYVDDGRWVGP
jgi:imidazolonepropionase-like amidohydrolase